MTKASDNAFPSVLITEGTVPTTPAAGKQRLYIDSTTHVVKVVNSGGTASNVGGGGGSGALVFLEAHTASSSASLDFTTFISSTYDEYMIDLCEIAPATDNVTLELQVGTGGGPTYDTGSNYTYMMVGRTFTDTAHNAGSSSAGFIGLGFSISNNGTYGIFNGSIRAYALQSTAHRKMFHGTCVYTNNVPAHVADTIGGVWITDGTAVTALRFLMSSGNIASGTIRIYGVSKT